jgi:hypothetical protein
VASKLYELWSVPDSSDEENDDNALDLEDVNKVSELKIQGSSVSVPRDEKFEERKDVTNYCAELMSKPQQGFFESRK